MTILVRGRAGVAARLLVASAMLTGTTTILLAPVAAAAPSAYSLAAPLPIPGVKDGVAVDAGTNQL